MKFLYVKSDLSKSEGIIPLEKIDSIFIAESYMNGTWYVCIEYSGLVHHIFFSTEEEALSYLLEIRLILEAS